MQQGALRIIERDPDQQASVDAGSRPASSSDGLTVGRLSESEKYDMGAAGPVVLAERSPATSPTKKTEYAFQCGNCACPDDGYQIVGPPTDFDRPLQIAWTHMQSLGSGTTLHFNPLRGQGVAVLNATAEALRLRFVRPQKIGDLGDDSSTQRAAMAMAELGVLEGVDALATKAQGRSTSLSVWMHVTNDCNLRCDYCYVRKSDEDMSVTVGRDAVDAVFRSARRGGFARIKLKFAGGEATLNLKRVLDIHGYAKTVSERLGIPVDASILSNGVSIGPRTMEAIERGGIALAISLDGIGDVHDSQRKLVNGGGSFHQVNRTVDRLISRGIRPFISITLSGRNADGLADVVDYVATRELPFNINFYRDNDCSSSLKDLRLEDDKIIAAMTAGMAVLEGKLPEHSLLGILVDRAVFDRPHDKPCGVGENYLVVDHRGNVSKCQMEIERPVTTIWADDPLSMIRADQIGTLNPSVDEKEGCRSCEWRYWCAGGCPAAAFRATGRYDIKSPYCRIYKAVYPQLLRLEGLRLLNQYRKLAPSRVQVSPS